MSRFASGIFDLLPDPFQYRSMPQLGKARRDRCSTMRLSGRLRPGQDSFDDVRILRVDDSPGAANLLQRIDQYAVSRRERVTFGGHVPFQGPSGARDRDARSGEANGTFLDAQSACLENRPMGELMRTLDFGSSLPPDSDNIDELGILREELGEGVHVVPIPGLRESVDDATDSMRFRRHA
jgi:hypothetical protein